MLRGLWKDISGLDAEIHIRTDANNLDAAAYFPHGEKAAAGILEGQLAFLSHVRRYEEQYPGCHILQQNLVWKYDFLRCFLGCLDEAELSTVAAEIRDVSHLSFNHGSWAVKNVKEYVSDSQT
eukprot:s292_g2.t1